MSAKNGLGDMSNALLDAARDGDNPTKADRDRVRARVLAKVGVGVAAGAATLSKTSAAVAGSTATGVSLTAKLIGTLITIGIVGSAIGYYRYDQARQNMRRVPVPVETSVTTSVPAVNLAPPPASASAEAKAEFGESSTLEAETRLLREAGVALRRGDNARALTLLDEHAARFPNGVLAEERSGERVFALCGLGRTTEAHKDAAIFLRNSPRSPLADRVRTACGAK